MTSRTINSPFGSRILRTGTINGRVAGVDPRIESSLQELEDLLAAELFEQPAEAATTPEAPTQPVEAAAGTRTPAGLDVHATMALPLRPSRPSRPSNDHERHEWERRTLAHALDEAQETTNKTPVEALVSLARVIANDDTLSQLADEFDSLLGKRWWELPFNLRVVLDRDYPAIRAYLVVLGYFRKNIKTAPGLVSFVSKNVDGADRLVDYGTISAARDWIKDENLKIKYRDDDDKVISDLREAKLSCAEDAFLPGVQAVVERSLNDTGTSGTERIGKLVDKHQDLFPDRFRASLIEYLKQAPVKIKASNIENYIPLYVQRIAGGIDITEKVPSRKETDQDFTVEFFTEDKELVEISRSAVKAAAQLYYTMILGDELQVFDVVNYFTHKYLVGRGFEISDPKLRRDLQMYVFSNQFVVTDSGSNLNRLVDRTQPAERMMFYRQVFNYGGGQITEDVIVNDEFSRLWKVLMLESAKYLERIQISPNPDTRVSRQNIMQAVEDLQYNLSIHSTGMATVMTPLIYAELSFITKRILMHEEVRKQVSPNGGSWWKVVETLYEGMKHTRPRATALNNKARLGHSIIRKIAEYDPEPFEQDDNFFPFISDVEAFITTQSILQEHLKDTLKEELADDETADDDVSEPDGVPLLHSPNGGGAAHSAPPSSGEWDF